MAPTPTDRRFAGPSAVSSPVFAGIRSQWEALGVSRRFRRRLAEWASRHPVLAEFDDGVALMAVAPTSRDVLEALADEALADELAMTATMRSLLPRLMFLVNRSGPTGIDLDERCATVVEIAHETVVRCRPGTAACWYDRRLWSNISKRYNRWVDGQLSSIDARSERLSWVSVSDEGGCRSSQRVAAALVVEPDPVGDAFALAELCDWVVERAGVDLDTARLIVLTRAGGVPVAAVVAASAASAQTVRRRRLRGEKRLVAAAGRV